MWTQVSTSASQHEKCRSVQAAVQCPVDPEIENTSVLIFGLIEPRMTGRLAMPVLARKKRYADGCDKNLHVSRLSKIGELLMNYTNICTKMENHAAESSWCGSLCALTSPLQRLSDQG